MRILFFIIAKALHMAANFILLPVDGDTPGGNGIAFCQARKPVENKFGIHMIVPFFTQWRTGRRRSNGSIIAQYQAREQAKKG